MNSGQNIAGFRATTATGETLAVRQTRELLDGGDQRRPTLVVRYSLPFAIPSSGPP